MNLNGQLLGFHLMRTKMAMNIIKVGSDEGVRISEGLLYQIFLLLLRLINWTNCLAM